MQGTGFDKKDDIEIFRSSIIQLRLIYCLIIITFLRYENEQKL